MADIPMSELRNLPPGGSSNPLVNAIDAGRTAVCSVYQSAPAQVVVNNGLPDPTGAGRMSRAFFDNLCADKGLPPPPAIPFPGGRCAGTTYQVVVVYNTGQGADLTNVRTYPGPIGAVSIGPAAGGAFEMKYSFGSGPSAGFQSLILGGAAPGPNNVSNWRVISQSVTPVSGPDNCGSNLPQFPPRQAPSTDFDKPITYPGPGGPITEPFKWPPVVWPDGPVEIPFKPEITIEIGELNIVFDFSGASILPVNIDAEIVIGGKPGGGSTNPNPSKPNSPQLDGVAIADRFDRIEDLLKQLEECACDEYTPTLVPTTGATLPSQCISLSVERNRFVALNIIQAPSNAATYSGGSAPNVYQAGWAWFKAGDFLFERQPIDALGKVFRNPGGATSFCYTLKVGYDGFPILLDEPIT